MGRHHRDQLVSPELAHGLPFQVANAADAAMGEQLIAAGMHAGDHGDRQLAIDRDGVRPRRVRVEIELAAAEVFFRRWDGRVYVAHISEPFGAQQRFADILRGETDDRRPAEPDSGGLQRRLGRPRSQLRLQSTCRPGQGRHA